MKIVTIVGARPQFIKAAAVSRALAGLAGVVEELVHTGQHYDENMSQVFFDELDIPRPRHHLGVGSGPHGQQTGRMLAAIEQVLLEARPDWTLVYGDTNSTLAGALAAAKLRIRVAHVEAGVRSFQRGMAEEINRVLTDHVAELLLAPTATAVENLRREGLPQGRVHLVGDVTCDAALHYAAKAEAASQILARLGLQPRRYALATVHRAENTDDTRRLRTILAGLGRLAAELPVVLPLHPRTRHALTRAGLAPLAQRLVQVEPLGYLDMIQLERHARLIATDSGGVQKEAFFFGVPCLTMRDETEWVELIEHGGQRLVTPLSEATLDEAFRAALAASPAASQPAQLFGNGRAAETIAHLLLER